MKHTRISLFALLLLCLVAAGCLEKKETVTVNPDGTGRWEFDLLLAPPPPMNLGAKDQAATQPDPQQQLKTLVESMVTKSTGYTAWKDIKAEVAADGRFHVSGVAYFPDFNNRKLQLGPFGTDSNETWRKNDAGGMTLQAHSKKQPPAAAGAPPAPAAAAQPVTDEQAEQMVSQMRTQWQQMKPMMGAMLGTMKQDSTYVLPGKVVDAGAFEATPTGVHVVIEGQKVLAGMEKMMADEASLRAMAKAGRNLQREGPSDEKMAELVLGRPGQLAARVEGDLKPLFDYQAQSAAAQAGMPAMLKELGIELPADAAAKANGNAQPATAP